MNRSLVTVSRILMDVTNAFANTRCQDDFDETRTIACSLSMRLLGESIDTLNGMIVLSGTHDFQYEIAWFGQEQSSGQACSSSVRQSVQIVSSGNKNVL